MEWNSISIELIPDAVITADREGVIRQVNRPLIAMFGYQSDELVGQPIEILLPERARKRHIEHRRFFQLNPGIGPMRGNFEPYGRRKDGSEFPVDVRLRPLPADDGHVLAVIRDNTAVKQLSDRLQQLTYSDRLTELPNCEVLYRELELCFRGHPEAHTAIALFDLDGFKEVNDTLGHSRGNQLLTQIARRWSAITGQGHRIYRLGGDEFALLIPNCGDPTIVAAAVKAMLHALDLPFDATVGFVSACAGIAIAPADGADIEMLIANVDLALHKAKARGRGSYVFFDNTLRAEMQARKNLDTKLRHAYLNGELELYFQPQVRLSDGAVVGSEALLRWNQGGIVVGPGAFIDVLASSPIAAAAGRWILRTACETAASWQSLGLSSRVSVNLFPIQFHDPFLINELEQVLAETRLSPSSLELEITENTALGSNDATLAATSQIRELGIGVALDDFGTGYASLSHLAEIPLTRIKIERSFIRKLPDDHKLAAIVRSLIAMAHNVGLRVTAEGVETAAQARFLRDMGCDEAQGFLFARPLTAAIFEALLKTSPWTDGHQSIAG
jgi:diguanylate cyclase (GGDEF)-like protein/PAS domain S-box-containing protein